ncbi:MAG: DivIVA domain-containing protein [Oscillospiraceae bacterium]|nr:DivIVA domain-containing protein [Oscillospiraceae bacterium]
MFTPKEIRDTVFDKAVRGYNTDDVDAFLSQLADQIETLEADKSDAESKMMMLAEKLEAYRKDEDTLRSALITSERLKEAVLTEARQKSEILVNDAQMKADQITSAANQQVEKEEEAYDTLKKEIAAFKHDVLGMYKKHLELLNDLPEDDAAAEPEEEPQQADETPAAPEVKEPVVPKAAEAVIEEDMEPAAAEEPAKEAQTDLFANFTSEAPDDKEDKEDKKEDEMETRFGKLDFGDHFTFDK